MLGTSTAAVVLQFYLCAQGVARAGTAFANWGMGLHPCVSISLPPALRRGERHQLCQRDVITECVQASDRSPSVPRAQISVALGKITQVELGSCAGSAL